jgi:hypothetical protein
MHDLEDFRPRDLRSRAMHLDPIERFPGELDRKGREPDDAPWRAGLLELQDVLRGLREIRAGAKISSRDTPSGR